jgi:outer membrane protein OmpA-like peptidoglycan-associated protein
MVHYSIIPLAVRSVIIGVALVLLAPIASAQELESDSGDPLPTQPGDFSLRIEPGLAIPLSSPQSDIFNVGFGQSIKAMWALSRYFDLGPSVTFLALPTEEPPGDGLGTAWAFGAGLRLKRPHDTLRDGFRAISPWIDVDVLYVRTDDLNRFGYDIGAGLAVPMGRSRVFWLGPFVRYFQITQPNPEGFDNHHAKILSVGLSLEVGSGIKRQREVVVTAAAETCTPGEPTYYCPDRDNDGVPDNVDRCPDVAGPMDNWGCPMYKKVVVKRDKLELKEKIQFAWNDDVIQDVSHPLLDEVAQALKDNKSFRVAVEGHASSEGTDEHNQDLSEKRAEAVLDYLVAKGISRDRLGSKGFSSSVPIDTNVTSAGREANRRVEFVVHFIIVNEGSK